MRSSDLRRTLELLADDRAASPTEREHARRLLSRMYADPVAQPSDSEVDEARVEFTGGDWVVEQKAARVAKAISGMAVVLHHDDSGYRLVGDVNVVSALSRTIDDIQGTERDDWGDRMRVAWMAQFMTMVYEGLPNTIVAGRDSMRAIREALEERGLSADPVHPRVDRDWRNVSRRASRLAADLLS